MVTFNRTSKLRRVLNVLFSPKYLLITNVTVAASVSGIGDVIYQKYEKMQQRRQNYKFARTRNQALEGGLYGALYHFWYLLLDRRWPTNSARAVACKTVVDLGIMMPIYIPFYLTSLSMLEGRDRVSTMNELKTKLPSLLVFELTVGTATKVFNFFFLPTRYRVLYDCSIYLCSDCYYSYVKYRKQLKEGDSMDLTDPP